MGVSNVEDLKHVLGTADDSPSPKSQQGEDAEKLPSLKKSQSESLFYRDSSTFLKVWKLLYFEIIKLNKF